MIEYFFESQAMQFFFNHFLLKAIHVFLFINVFAHISYSDCLNIMDLLEKADNSKKLSDVERIFKKNSSSDECAFYIGEKYFLLKNNYKFNRMNAERLLLRASIVLRDSNKNFLPTFKYLLTIEIEKECPDIKKMDEYYKRIENCLPNSEKLAFQQQRSKIAGNLSHNDPDKTTESKPVNQESSVQFSSEMPVNLLHPQSIEPYSPNSTLGLPTTEVECWNLFGQYQYNMSIECFKSYAEERSDDTDVYSRTIERILLFERMIKRKKLIESNYQNNCQTYTYKQNETDIQSWFDPFGDFGRQHWYYPDSNPSRNHKHHFSTCNLIAFGRCQFKQGHYGESLDAFKKAVQTKEFLTNEEYTELIGLLKKVQNNQQKSNHIKIQHTVPKSPKNNSKKTINKPRIDESKGWNFFKQYQYDQAIKQFQKYQKRMKDGQDKKIDHSIAFIQQFTKKKQYILDQYSANCHWRTYQNIAIKIVDWFSLKGDLSDQKYDYPNDSPALHHSYHLNTFSWLTFGRCRDENQVYLSLTDILKIIDNNSQYLNNEQKEKLRKILKRSKEKQTYILEYDTNIREQLSY